MTVAKAIGLGDLLQPTQSDACETMERGEVELGEAKRTASARG